MIKRFNLLVCLVLAIIATTMSVKAEVNWASQGSTPSANNQFYIYNAASGYFLLNNGNSTNASITNSPITAEGKYFTLSSATSATVRIGNNNRSCTITAVSGANYKLVYTTSGLWDWSCWCNPKIDNYVYTSGSSLSTSTSSTGNYNRWVFIPKATFDALKHTYNARFEARVGSAGGGSAKVGLTNPLPGNATEEASISGVYFGDDYAYFEATASTNFEFVGWSRDAAGTRMVDGAVNTLYPVLIPNNDGGEQDVFTYYAIFEPVSPYEAQVVHYTDLGEEVSTPYALLGEAITAAASNDKVQILKNINLTSAIAISKHITLDLNGFSLRGSGNLLTLNSSNLTITDGNMKTSNGFILNASSTSAVSAITVAGGTLTFANGRISAANSSTGAVSGILVSDGNLIMQGNGGIINVNAANGCGVQVNASKTATLAQGTINAEGGAVGVLANGTVKITHSIKVNASNSSTVGVRINNASADVTIDGGVITAPTIAIQAQNGKVTCGGSMEAKVTATSGAYALKQEGSTAEVTVCTGRFYTPLANAQDVIAATASKLKLYGGYYVHNTALNSYKQEGVGVAELKSGTTFYTQGYRYVLSDGENPNYVAYTANGRNFSSLEDALDYANTNPNTTMTILQVVPEYTLPAGNYTLPAKATLLIPYVANQSPKSTIERIRSASGSISMYSILNMDAGANLNVFGIVEVGCKQNVEGQGESGIGRPVGSYGQIHMKGNSRMILSSGALLRGWGFITGDRDADGKYACEIDARRGSIVREQFQMQDWKGGSASSDLLKDPNKSTNKVFPVCQYFIQNVEVPTKYHPGAQLICSAGMYVSYDAGWLGTYDATPVTDAIGLIGVRRSATDKDDAMFLLKDEDESEDTWVRKYYDVKNDKQVYEVNNSAELGNLAFDLSATIVIIDIPVNMNSTDYILPVTSNMKIHLLTGKMEITQSTELLPGAEIEVDKESVVSIAEGQSLFLYDADQWYDQLFGVESGNCISRVKNRPGGRPNVRKLKWADMKSYNLDAKINVHGTFEAEGAIYTTTSGAQIISSVEDAGTITFIDPAPAADATKKIYQINGASASSFADANSNSAQLMNSSAYASSEGGQAYTPTGGTGAYQSFCYMDIDGKGGRWTNLSTLGCFVIDEGPNPDVYYAKPQEYVQLIFSEIIEHELEDNEYIGIKDDLGNDTHTYAYTSPLYPRLDTVLICMPDCQWWKVLPVEESDSLVYCPANGNYYFWDVNRKEESATVPGWVEKRFKVTWKNWNGSTIATYQQAYKTMPSYQGATPTRNYTDYYTYTFTGWMPEISPVMGDVVYTAQFAENDRKYTISFYDEDGETLIESQQCKIGDVPVCYNTPSKDGMRLEWLPFDPIAVSANGQHNYTASFTAEEKAAYTITFFDFNGNVLQSSEVAVGAMPVYDEANGKPSKPSDGTNTFVWNGGWTPEIVAVAGNASYTATFDKVPKKYTITWQDKDGNEIEHADWGYGEIPVCSNPPTKAPTVAEYYEVIWNPLVSSVTGNQTYRENGFTAYKNTCRLTVNAGANGKVALAGSETVLTNIYDFGDEVAISATADEHYHFVQWSDGNTDASRTIIVNAAITLTAEFAIDQVQISWNWANNDVNPRVDVQTLDYGAMPSHGTPVKNPTPGYTYTFAGWDKPIVEATSNTTYTAIYTPVAVQYTLRFIYNNGREDFVKAYDNGSTPIITNPTKTNAGMDYIFAGWKNSAGEFTVAGTEKTTLPMVDKLETYTAQYSLITGEGTPNEITLDGPTSLFDLTIHTNGSVEMNGGVALTVNNLYLEATSDESGQLFGANVSATNAYFDLKVSIPTHTWYAIAVPWQVDAEGGISINGRTLEFGKDFDILYYDGAARAANGANKTAWKYMEDEYEEGYRILQPGTLYMIGLMMDAPQGIRFTKKTGANILTTSTSVTAHGGNADAIHNGWNGIANPAVYHAYMNAGSNDQTYGANYGQIYDAEHNAYTSFDMEHRQLVVGQPIFVQVPTGKSIVVNRAEYAPSSAPVRRANAENRPENFEVSLSATNTSFTDKLIVRLDEDKEDTYVIGQDLAKMGVSSVVPQLWINRYDAKLCMNTQSLTNGVAEYPLSIYAPVAGDYTITNHQSPITNEDYTLYLTLDGQAIWNLSESPYTLTLGKGTATNYGLRISARAPQTATGTDEAIIDARGETKKVLINDKVYIIREGQLYSVDGRKVK